MQSKILTDGLTSAVYQYTGQTVGRLRECRMPRPLLGRGAHEKSAFDKVCVPQAEIEGSKIFPRTPEIDIFKNRDKYA